MITPIDSYTQTMDEAASSTGRKLTAVCITAVLTLLASFWWSGLALVGVALLALAAVCIIMALIITRTTGQSAWSMAIAGQFAGVLGTAVLFWAALV
ncbi:MAG TPA: hypothetical protein PLD25_24935 [Chloroflexota bacterium]|nr:hypothetical protein [Chloroflexota bacterium]